MSVRSAICITALFCVFGGVAQVVESLTEGELVTEQIFAGVASPQPAVKPLPIVTASEPTSALRMPVSFVEKGVTNPPRPATQVVVPGTHAEPRRKAVSKGTTSLSSAIPVSQAFVATAGSATSFRSAATAYAKTRVSAAPVIAGFAGGAVKSPASVSRPTPSRSIASSVVQQPSSSVDARPSGLEWQGMEFTPEEFVTWDPDQTWDEQWEDSDGDGVPDDIDTDPFDSDEWGTTSTGSTITMGSTLTTSLWKWEINSVTFTAVQPAILNLDELLPDPPVVVEED